MILTNNFSFLSFNFFNKKMRQTNNSSRRGIIFEQGFLKILFFLTLISLLFFQL